MKLFRYVLHNDSSFRKEVVVIAEDRADALRRLQERRRTVSPRTEAWQTLAYNTLDMMCAGLDAEGRSAYRTFLVTEHDLVDGIAFL